MARYPLAQLRASAFSEEDEDELLRKREETRAFNDKFKQQLAQQAAAEQAQQLEAARAQAIATANEETEPERTQLRAQYDASVNGPHEIDLPDMGGVRGRTVTVDPSAAYPHYDPLGERRPEYASAGKEDPATNPYVDPLDELSFQGGESAAQEAAPLPPVRRRPGFMTENAQKPPGSYGQAYIRERGLKDNPADLGVTEEVVANASTKKLKANGPMIDVSGPGTRIDTPQQTPESEQNPKGEPTPSKVETPFQRKAQSRDYGDSHGRMSDGQGHVLGLPDAQDSERARLMNEAGLAYDSAPPQSHAWEEEFQQQQQQYEDQNRSRYRWQALFGGVEYADKMAAETRQNQAAYWKDRYALRERDRRISRGMAQAIVGARMATPEVAATLTMDDPIVKAFTNGGYAQALGNERLNQQYYKDRLGTETRLLELEGKERMNGANIAGRYREAQARNRAMIEQAKLLKQTKGSVSLQEVPQVGAYRVAVRLEEALGLPGESIEHEKLMSFVMSGGLPEDLPPEYREHYEVAKRALVEAQTYAQAGATKTTELAPGPVGTKTRLTGRARNETSEKTFDRKQGLAQASQALFRTEQAVAKLAALEGGRALDRYVKLGPNSPEAARDAGTTKLEQALMTELDAFRADAIKEGAGLSQTAAEIKSQAMKMGLTAETWNPFKHPDGFRAALSRVKAKLRLDLKLLKDEGRW